MSPWMWQPLSKPRQAVSGEKLYCCENPKCHSSICTLASHRHPPPVSTPLHFTPVIFLFSFSLSFPPLPLRCFGVTLPLNKPLVLPHLQLLRKIKDETGTSAASSNLPTELFFLNLNNYGYVFTCFLVSQHGGWLARYCPLQYIFMLAADRMGLLNQLQTDCAVRKLHRFLVFSLIWPNIWPDACTAVTVNSVREVKPTLGLEDILGKAVKLKPEEQTSIDKSCHWKVKNNSEHRKLLMWSRYHEGAEQGCSLTPGFIAVGTKKFREHHQARNRKKAWAESQSEN